MCGEGTLALSLLISTQPQASWCKLQPKSSTHQNIAHDFTIKASSTNDPRLPIVYWLLRSCRRFESVSIAVSDSMKNCLADWKAYLVKRSAQPSLIAIGGDIYLNYRFVIISLWLEDNKIIYRRVFVNSELSRDNCLFTIIVNPSFFFWSFCFFKNS